MEELPITGGGSFSVKSGSENKPVNFVSFWDAARFSNWLTNGQGSGDTETGVYNLTAAGITNNTVTRDLTYGYGTQSEVWALQSRNEWYKAAYYSGSSYFDYPTQSDSISTADANYADSVGTVTVVGTYAGDGSHYGTFDQGGNVREWDDTIVGGVFRGARGGAFDSVVADLQASDYTVGVTDPANELAVLGFRVASLSPIPEPSAYAAILGCLGLGLALMRRKGRA